MLSCAACASGHSKNTAAIASAQQRKDRGVLKGRCIITSIDALKTEVDATKACGYGAGCGFDKNQVVPKRPQSAVLSRVALCSCWKKFPGKSRGGPTSRENRARYGAPKPGCEVKTRNNYRFLPREKHRKRFARLFNPLRMAPSAHFFPQACVVSTARSMRMAMVTRSKRRCSVSGRMPLCSGRNECVPAYIVW